MRRIFDVAQKRMRSGECVRVGPDAFENAAFFSLPQKHAVKKG